MITCYIGIGSNIGNRLKNITQSVQRIRLLPKTEVIKLSTIIETKPLGGPRCQGKFLNAALKIKTNLTLFSLLRGLKQIESELGRTMTVRNGPRSVDLDILFYGDEIINKKGLTVPHPRMLGRDFVIRPLLEIL